MKIALRTSVCLLLVLVCFSFALASSISPGSSSRSSSSYSMRDVEEMYPLFNEKAKTKMLMRLNGDSSSSFDKHSLAQLRAEWFEESRRDPQLGYVPVERYGVARNVMLSSHSADVMSEKSDYSATRRVIGDAWTNMGPGEVGGRTRAILLRQTSPVTIFLGAAGGGVWRSSDGGQSFQPLTDLMGNLAVCTLASDPNNLVSPVIYAGTGEGFYNGDATRGIGIYKTIDNGDTWIALDSTLNSNFYYVNKLRVSPTNPSVVYAATRTGLWKSNDAGNTWNAIFTGGVFDVDATNITGQDRLVIWVAQQGIQVSMDAGNTWNTPSCGTGQQSCYSAQQNQYWWRASIAVAPSNTNVIYALHSDLPGGTIQNVWKSLDGGLTFSSVLNKGNTTAQQALNSVLLSNPYFSYTNTSTGLNCAGTAPSVGGQGWYDNIIMVHPTNPQIVWAGGVDMFRSDNGGVDFGLISTWWLSNPPQTNGLHADHHSIAFSPNFATDNTVYFGNDGGIWTSTNALDPVDLNPCDGIFSSTAFTPLNNGYSTIMFYHGVAPVSGTGYVAGAQDQGSWRWTGQGTAWEYVSGGDGAWCGVDPGNSQRFFTAYVYTHIERHDTGNFNSVLLLSGGDLPTMGSFINPYVIDPNNANVIYTCDSTMLWASTSALTASNFSTAGWTSKGLFGGNCLNNCTRLGNCTRGCAAAMWITPSSSDVYVVTKAAGFARYNIASQSFIKNAGSGLPGGVTAFSSVRTHPGDDSIVYVTISSFGVSHLWRSNDTGATFSPFGIGIPDIPVWDIFVDPNQQNQMYLGTDMGVWYSADGGQSWYSATVPSHSLSNTPVYRFDYQNSTNTLLVFTHGRGVYTTNPTGPGDEGSSSSSPGGLTFVQVTLIVGSVMVALLVGAVVAIIIIRRRRARKVGDSTPLLPKEGESIF